MTEHDHDCYGIVIDAGSSGSRVNVFKWDEPEYLLETSDDEKLLRSTPQIIQKKEWTFKVSPGLSTYREKPDKAFSKHIKPLLQFTYEIIPKDKLSVTPVFIQATAGMRLLREEERSNILKSLCRDMKRSTDFLVQDCESQIQVIDGETEGIYGWLGLNYLYGHFNSYDSTQQEHFTFGFMDMGGASTQIAFAPSNAEEVSKHRDDISTVYLRNINGEVQEWNVFVSTWLGFGANEARRRYLVQLINGLLENWNQSDDRDETKTRVTDPCIPKNCKTKFEYKGKVFEIHGSGNYEQCSKSIYPLLLKNLPCIEDPCLFNGVHAPQIDYYNDKFIGTSEYWYTANDVFKLGGTYNFEEFSSHVKDFCSTDWKVIKQNSEKGKYNSISTDFLIDSCFKANWVLNVLHEGFNLPRAGIDKIETAKEVNNYPLFQSADSVKNKELSWTLGRILLFACGSIKAGRNDITVGIRPSENSLITDAFESGLLISEIESRHMISRCIKILVVLALIVLWSKFVGRPTKNDLFQFLNGIKVRCRKIKYLRVSSDPQSRLEEGIFEENSEATDVDGRDGCKYRSKSMFNLNGQTVKNSFGHLSGNSTPAPFVPSSASRPPKMLRPAFSLADFSKFKDGKLND